MMMDNDSTYYLSSHLYLKPFQQPALNNTHYFEVVFPSYARNHDMRASSSSYPFKKISDIQLVFRSLKSKLSVAQEAITLRPVLIIVIISYYHHHHLHYCAQILVTLPGNHSCNPIKI